MPATQSTLRHLSLLSESSTSLSAVLFRNAYHIYRQNYNFAASEALMKAFPKLLDDLLDGDIQNIGRLVSQTLSVTRH